nr:MAG TPA: zinc-ribbon containing domain protein [Caudoviricetes sp.]
MVRRRGGRVVENSIEEDIELLQDETSSLGLFFKCKGSEKYKIALEHILLDYKRVLKVNECLKNHVHYKNCIACGKEFKSKRDDAKYCIKCSKQIANKNYIANLTEEQKLKRREQAKLAMRKLRANKK